MARNDRLAFLFLALVLASPSVASPSSDASSLTPALRQQLLLRQYAVAIPELRRLAALGNPEAQYQLALVRLEGSESAPDPTEAISLLEKAAATGHVKANYLLGSMYYQGKVVARDMAAARRHLVTAADQGHYLARDLLMHLEDSAEKPAPNTGTLQDRLWAAARSGSIDQAYLALEGGGDINAVDPAGATALIIAINARMEDMAIWLVEHGASPDRTDRSGDTPLHLAARQDMGALTRSLLDAGAKVDAENVDGRTPLMLAVVHRHADVARQLISAGASTRHADRQGQTARDLAAHLGDAALAAVVGASRQAGTLSREQRLALLRKQVAERDSIYHDWPLVAAAVAQDDRDLAMSLARGGEDPWLSAPTGESAVHLAVKRGHEYLARDLLRISPAATTDQQISAVALLALAAGKGDEDLVRDLLAATSPDSVARLPLQETPLWQAILAAQSGTALQIVGWQQPDRRRSASGMDLLLLASERGMSEVTFALLEQGFDIETSDNQGRTAVWFAADGGYCELLPGLVTRGARVDIADHQGQTPLMRSVLAGAQQCVVRTIAAGGDVNRQTSNGNTALMLAAQSQPQIVRLLLNAGADYEMRNKRSYTALMLATSAQCVGCIDALIAAGANARRKNSRGISAIDIAGDDAAVLAALRR